MWMFFIGFLSGILAVVIVAYVVLFNVFGKVVPLPPFIDQFQPLKVPPELKNFLRSRPEGGSEWESCFSISLLLHFLFQEHKDTRRFRRWVYKKLQLELNDVTTRSAAGRIILGIQIHDLSVGTQFPLVKSIRVEQFLMSEDRELFEELSFVVDLDYRGGFEMSVDVNMIFGRFAHLSVKLLRLSGKARITLTRRPFAHWTFAFTEMPELDFKIESQFQGRQLKHMIPLITQAFRKTLQRKHVWPNYKIRYRPLLPNPFLQPSPPISAFEHVKVNGTGLEVTVLQCTRLNTQVAELGEPSVPFEVYCSVSLDQRPFINNPKTNSTHCVSVMLTFTRKGAEDPIGLSFSKSAADSSSKAVKVQMVDPGSTAEKCGFKEGDILLAINNVPIRNERQATRILGGTSGDLLVLVERDLNFYMEDEHVEYEEEELLVDNGQEEFICVGVAGKKSRKRNEDSTDQNLRSDQEKIKERSSSPCSTDSHKNKPEPPCTPTRKPSTMEEGIIASAYVPVLSASLRQTSGPVSAHLPDQSLAKSSPEKTKSPSKEPEVHLSTPASPTTGASVSYKLEEDILVEEKPKMFDFKVESKTEEDSEQEVTEDQLVRTKSVHIPKLSVQESSVELRKSRSESELQLFSDPEYSSINTTLLNVTEDMDEEEEPEEDLEEEEVEEDFENSLIDGDDPSTTLQTTLRGVLKSKESSGPDSPKIAVSSRRERFQARASEMASRLHAGRSKVNDFLWSKRNQKDVSPSASLRSAGTAVYADMVGESEEGDPDRNADTSRRAVSPLAGPDDLNKPMPAEVAVQDKAVSKRRWMRRKGKSPTPSTSSQLPFVDSASSPSTKRPNYIGPVNESFPNSENDHSPNSLVSSRSTKAVPLAKNVLWGQSLHFGLEKKQTRYLNVTVHARRKEEVNNEEDGRKSILLGHTSVYIPQVVDDCQLTLANCHREVFQLRPPSSENSDPPVEFSDLARHTGFDNRLCFGDITLGFRFFPQGLPSTSIRTGVDSPKPAADARLAQELGQAEPVDDHPLQQGRNSPNPEQNQESLLNRSLSTPIHLHKWTAVHLKHGLSYPCGICRGKIWLKWASRCTVCNFVCHNKCVDKAGREHECVPDTRPMNFEDDAHFEVLDGAELGESPAAQPEVQEGDPNAADTDSIATIHTTSRRRRIANKVSEKLTTTWRNVGAPRMKKLPKQTSPSDSAEASITISSDQDSARTENGSQAREIEGNELVYIVHTLANDFPDLRLEGSPMLRELKFEPGNAYNSQVISDTKQAGQKVFEHIGDNSLRKARINDQIDAIQSRIDYLANLRRTIVDQGDREFEGIDARREALALLMLHYCSGLSECMDREELQHKQKMEQEALDKEKDVQKELEVEAAALQEKE